MFPAYAEVSHYDSQIAYMETNMLSFGALREGINSF